MWIGLVIPAVANYGGNASELGDARGGLWEEFSFRIDGPTAWNGIARR